MIIILIGAFILSGIMIDLVLLSKNNNKWFIVTRKDRLMIGDNILTYDKNRLSTMIKDYSIFCYVTDKDFYQKDLKRMQNDDTQNVDFIIKPTKDTLNDKYYKVWKINKETLIQINSFYNSITYKKVKIYSFSYFIDLFYKHMDNGLDIFLLDNSLVLMYYENEVLTIEQHYTLDLFDTVKDINGYIDAIVLKINLFLYEFSSFHMIKAKIHFLHPSMNKYFYQIVQKLDIVVDGYD